MAGVQLNRMAAHAAYEELQKAYGFLFCSDGIEQTEQEISESKAKAEEHLKSVNNWLLALKAE